MHQRTEYERIRSILDGADVEGPLTAREIANLLREHGEDIDSSHRVATILGRQARRGEVEVVGGTPYRYEV
jgi:predicted Zn-ribbon and HTH transcriptional regulator